MAALYNLIKWKVLHVLITHNMTMCHQPASLLNRERNFNCLGLLRASAITKVIDATFKPLPKINYINHLLKST